MPCPGQPGAVCVIWVSGSAYSLWSSVSRACRSRLPFLLHFLMFFPVRLGRWRLVRPQREWFGLLLLCGGGCGKPAHYNRCDHRHRTLPADACVLRSPGRFSLPAPEKISHCGWSLQFWARGLSSWSPELLLSFVYALGLSLGPCSPLVLSHVHPTSVFTFYFPVESY